MNRLIIVTVFAAITLVGTYLFNWIWIPILIGVASWFLQGTNFLKNLLAFLVPSTIWIIIAASKDLTSVVRPSELIGQLFNDISPIYIFVATGFIIGICCSLYTSAILSIKSLLKK